MASATSTISMDLVFRGVPDAGMASAALMIGVKQILSETVLNGPFIRRLTARRITSFTRLKRRAVLWPELGKSLAGRRHP